MKQVAGKVSAGCALETCFRMWSSVRTSVRHLLISQLYLAIHKAISKGFT